MPCTYYTAGEIEAMTRADNQRLAAQVNDLTAKLCMVTRALFNQPLQVIEQMFSPREFDMLTEWHSEHTAKDKARLQKEGLAKLTAEEKKALGLDGL